MKFLRPDISAGSSARIAFAFWLTWVLINPPTRNDLSRQNPSSAKAASAALQASASAKSLAFAPPAVPDRGDGPLEMDEDDVESSREIFDPRDVWIPAPAAPLTSGCSVYLSESPPPLLPSRLRC